MVKLFGQLLNWKLWALPTAASVVLVVIAQYDFLAFHTFAELFAIVIAFVMFALAWSTYEFSKNSFLLFLACGYFWIGSLDLMHTLVYKGMNVFVEGSGNLSVQFWIGTRYSEALLLLAAPFAAAKKQNRYQLITVFGGIAVGLTIYIFSGKFPTGFVEGTGLTDFKIYSEYLIDLILVLALTALFRHGRDISPYERALISISIVLTMCAELAFTFYVDVYGLSNLAGHIFKLFSFWLIFQAIVISNLKRPYRDLKAEKETSDRQLAQIQKQESLFEAMFNAMSDAIVMADTERRIIAANRSMEKTFGYTIDDLAGKTTSILYESEEEFERQGRIRFNITAEEKSKPYEVNYRRKDGQVFVGETLGTAIKGTTGKTLGFIGVMRDITHRKEAETLLIEAKEEAEYANYAKTQFLANMSHELRTPLNGIIGFSEMMTQEVLGPLPEVYGGYATDIHTSGQHLLELITDILDTSKLDMGVLELHETEVDLQTVAAECIKLIEQKANEASVTLSMDIPADIPHLNADDTRVKEILLNLLSNAVKFTPRNGQVVIDAQLDEEEGVLVVRVKDTGRGIAAEDIPKILEPFKQVEDIFTRSHEGSGLGLPLSKRLIELHGGSLAIDSELGKGTTVAVRFPSERVINDA